MPTDPSMWRLLISEIKTLEACTVFAPPHHRIKEATSRCTAKHYDCHCQPSSTQYHQFPTKGSPNPTAMYVFHPPTQLQHLTLSSSFVPFPTSGYFLFLTLFRRKLFLVSVYFCFHYFLYPYLTHFRLLPAHPLSISLPQDYDSHFLKLLFLNCKLFQHQYKDSSSKVDIPIRTSYETNKQMGGGNCLHNKQTQDNMGSHSQRREFINTNSYTMGGHFPLFLGKGRSHVFQLWFGKITSSNTTAIDFKVGCANFNDVHYWCVSGNRPDTWRIPADMAMRRRFPQND